jgi:hypothetical protein
MTHPVLVEIAEWDRNRPRSQQVAIGASQLLGCRAATILRLNEIPETDGRLRWDALVGTAIHAVAEQAAPDTVIVEGRFSYRGVWATVDRYDPTTRILTDIKSKADALALHKARRYGPSRQHKAQLHLGAAALQEAGHEVAGVELLYLPRNGKPEDAFTWGPIEPSRAAADFAAEWAEWVTREAAERKGRPVAEQVEGLQDERPQFCRDYCPFVTACRGPVETFVPVEKLEDVL